MSRGNIILYHLPEWHRFPEELKDVEIKPWFKYIMTHLGRVYQLTYKWDGFMPSDKQPLRYFEDISERKELRAPLYNTHFTIPD